MVRVTRRSNAASRSKLRRRHRIVEGEPHYIASKTFQPPYTNAMTDAPKRKFIGEEIRAIAALQRGYHFRNDFDITAMVAKPFPHGLAKRCHHHLVIDATYGALKSQKPLRPCLRWQHSAGS